LCPDAAGFRVLAHGSSRFGERTHPVAQRHGSQSGEVFIEGPHDAAGSGFIQGASEDAQEVRWSGQNPLAESMLILPTLLPPLIDEKSRLAGLGEFHPEVVVRCDFRVCMKHANDPSGRALSLMPEFSVYFWPTEGIPVNPFNPCRGGRPPSRSHPGTGRMPRRSRSCRPAWRP